MSEILKMLSGGYNFYVGGWHMITFEPFWNTLKEKNITVYELLEKHKFSHGTYDSIKKNKNVTLNTIDQLCKILNCNVCDIVEYKEDED